MPMCHATPAKVAPGGCLIMHVGCALTRPDPEARRNLLRGMGET